MFILEPHGKLVKLTLTHEGFAEGSKLLDGISKLPIERQKAENRIKALLQFVERHMESEEEVLFPRIRQCTDEAERVRLGRYMRSMQSRARAAAA